jgi:hypothetical protein
MLAAVGRPAGECLRRPSKAGRPHQHLETDSVCGGGGRPSGLPATGCLRHGTPLEGLGHLEQASWRVRVLAPGHGQVHRELLEGQDLQDG